MTHHVEIQGRNMEVTDQLHDYISGKAEKLDRYLKEIEETRVELAFAKSARSAADRHVAQITIRGRRLLLRSEERADDIFTAFDAALSKMQRQIERYKGKRKRGRGDGRSAAEASGFVPADEEIAVDEVAVVRRKKFAVRPMTEEEAIEQMSLLGHNNFFIFYNGETHKINVLYRRRDGDFGLIEPEIG
ncbi:MAG: ribosome-associated translation inhibitor RaiA [Anaerolineales bacterium]|nr:ribosome-associated translation inhibitor RaiA [Anaerolineales bacterium]